jgi:RNA polymerase sigma-70 factor (ECF subfamily)
MTISFSEQIVECAPRLTWFARRLSRNSSTADDLVQETILRALIHADQFTPGTNLLAWLRVILRNCYLTECRKAARLVSIEIPDTLPMPSISCPQESHVRLTEVECRLVALSAGQRQALTLVGAGGHSYEHAAQLAGCDIGTMKRRVSRGRESLQVLLKKPAPRPIGIASGRLGHLDQVARWSN